MAKRKTVQPEDTTQFINEFLQEDERAKQVLSLSNATLGVMQSTAVEVHTIDRGLTHAKGLPPKRAVKQVDRLLINRGIDVNRYFSYSISHVFGDTWLPLE